MSFIFVPGPTRLAFATCGARSVYCIKCKKCNKVVLSCLVFEPYRCFKCDLETFRRYQNKGRTNQTSRLLAFRELRKKLDCKTHTDTSNR